MARFRAPPEDPSLFVMRSRRALALARLWSTTSSRPSGSRSTQSAAATDQQAAMVTGKLDLVFSGFAPRTRAGIAPRRVPWPLLPAGGLPAPQPNPARRAMKPRRRWRYRARRGASSGAHRRRRWALPSGNSSSISLCMTLPSVRTSSASGAHDRSVAPSSSSTQASGLTSSVLEPRGAIAAPYGPRRPPAIAGGRSRGAIRRRRQVRRAAIRRGARKLMRHGPAFGRQGSNLGQKILGRLCPKQVG